MKSVLLDILNIIKTALRFLRGHGAYSLMGIFVFLYFIVCVIILKKCLKREYEIDDKYKYICERLKAWLFGCLAWRMLEYFLIALSLISSFFAIWYQGQEHFFTILAVGSSVISIIISPSKHIHSNRMAYTLLDYAVNLFLIDKISPEELIKTVSICESINDESYDVSLKKEYMDFYEYLSSDKENKNTVSN